MDVKASAARIFNEKSVFVRTHWPAPLRTIRHLRLWLNKWAPPRRWLTWIRNPRLHASSLPQPRAAPILPSCRSHAHIPHSDTHAEGHIRSANRNQHEKRDPLFNGKLRDGRRSLSPDCRRSPWVGALLWGVPHVLHVSLAKGHGGAVH